MGYVRAVSRGVLSLSCVLVPLLSGCGGSVSTSDSGTTTPASTFSRIQTQVFNVSCSSDSCHSHVGKAGDMVLEQGMSWDSLVSHVPSNPLAASHGYMRVMPGDPLNSLLYLKISNSLQPGEGFPMPYGAALLPVHAIAVIRAWISAGAPHDGLVPGDDGQPLNTDGDGSGNVTLPLPAKGVQLHVITPPIPDGKENTSCHFFKLPSDVDLEIARFETAVSGGSHHIHLYRPSKASVDLPDHSEDCNMAVNFDDWQLVAATQQRSTDWQLPPGIAYHLKAGEQLLMQTHFVNVGALETRGEGQVVMNLHAIDASQVTAHAGTIFGQDKDVFVPAHSETTEAAECVFPNAMTLMAQTGHYHFRGRRFTTYRWDNGTPGEVIYQYEGYDDPPFLIYDPAESPQFTPGQGLQWECYWVNNTGSDFKFGPFTDTNEHCNWFGFYYPTQEETEFTTCVKNMGVSTTTVRHVQ
ncbi:MAG: hypothetical protein HY270_05075 [Deltaproteobacteria bacterium]|nr:hypothetical protein [Deltaproteobacteria bacterium]